MALTVFNASCLAKWPCCEVDDDDREARCNEGDDAMIASGSEASLFFFWVTGELSTLRQMMKVPNEPGLCPNNDLENAEASEGCVDRVAWAF